MPLENTANRNYPKPHRANKLKDDIERIRQTFESLGIDIETLWALFILKADLAALAEYQLLNQKDQPGGYVGLDAQGFIAAARLHPSLRGGLIPQGEWNAFTNTPDLPVPSSSNKGWMWIVSADGATSKGGITDWKLTDVIWSDGVTFRKIDNTDKVTSVAGRTGAVVITQADVIGGSKWRHVQTVDVVNENSISITQLQHYDKVTVDVSNVQVSLSGATPTFRLIDGAVASQTGYTILTISPASVAGAPAAPVADKDAGTTGFFFSNASDGDTTDDPHTLDGQRIEGTLTFHGFGSPQQTYVTGQGMYTDPAGNPRLMVIGGVHTVANTMSGLNISMPAGATFTGRITVHGLLRA
jgi:hypothetical protein